MTFRHRTVLLAETVALLRPGAQRVIVDGTLGGGGHAEALLEAGATVVGLDRDDAALAAARTRLARFGDRFRAVEGNYAEALALVGHPVHGFLLDLGVSSHQLDTAERGFSFQADGPLDMRMGSSGPTAAELIAELDERALADAIYRDGEERFSRQIARRLKFDLPTTTAQAVKSIEAAVPRKDWPKGIHVATRTFQALRINVNDELGALDTALEGLDALLEPGGVAAIISFHSLEDRRVKQAFKVLCGEVPDETPRGFPVAPPRAQARFQPLTKKPIEASEAEVADNPRSRSAKLRAVEKRS